MAAGDDYDELLRQVNESLGGRSSSSSPAPRTKGGPAKRGSGQAAERESGGRLSHATTVAIPAGIASGALFWAITAFIPFFPAIQSGLVAFAATWLTVMIEELRHR